MGITHIRLPKNFVLEERLERYASVIEQQGTRWAGHWAHACWPLGRPQNDGRTCFERVHLDLGCGKGAFLVQSAQAHPNTLFIGADVEAVCIAYAAQHVWEANLSNALIVPRSARAVGELFAPQELDAITLNFPTPYPRKRHAHQRLVSLDYLMLFRPLLAPGATITLRTDSLPLRNYARTQFQAAHYDILWDSDDTRTEHPSFAQTEYEARLVEQGASVFGICATPASIPPSAQSLERGQAAEQSLMHYLPHDLSSLDYVPYGMEAAVANARNRIKNAAHRVQS